MVSEVEAVNPLNLFRKTYNMCLKLIFLYTMEEINAPFSVLVSNLLVKLLA